MGRVARIVRVGIAVGWAGALAVAGFAAVSKDVLIGHQFEIYPKSVLETPGGDPHQRLSKDSIDAVAKFFKARQQEGDHMTTSGRPGEPVYEWSARSMIKGQEQAIMEVRIASVKVNNLASKALGELKMQVQYGRHTLAEYNSLAQQYKDLQHAFYRMLPAEDGQLQSEGELIYQKAYQQAHPDAEAREAEAESEAQQAEDEAREAAMEKKLAALQAKGDFAGMMKLSQQSRAEAMEQSGMNEEMKRDTWNLWVHCLVKLKEAAYYTRIEYGPNALPQ